MAQKTDSQLQTLANTVQNETTASANSATRMGGLLNDFNDSKINKDKVSSDIDADTGSDTKVPSVAAVEAFVAQEIAAAPSGVGYKTYKVYMTQSGSSAPTATIIKNTLSGTPTLSRTSTGTYRITLTAAFPSAKTFIQNNFRALTFSDPNFITIFVTRGSDDYIEIQTRVGANGTEALTDGVLAGTDIDIVVFD